MNKTLWVKSFKNYWVSYVAKISFFALLIMKLEQILQKKRMKYWELEICLKSKTPSVPYGVYSRILKGILDTFHSYSLKISWK